MGSMFLMGLCRGITSAKCCHQDSALSGSNVYFHTGIHIRQVHPVQGLEQGETYEGELIVRYCRSCWIVFSTTSHCSPHCRVEYKHCRVDKEQNIDKILQMIF